MVTDADLALTGPGTTVVVDDLADEVSIRAAGARLGPVDAVVGVDDAALPATIRNPSGK